MRKSIFGKTAAKVISLAVLFILVFSLSLGAFAWLGGWFTGKEEIPFTAGTTEPLKAHMWRYTTEAEGTAGWEHFCFDGDTCNKAADGLLTYDTSSYDNEVMLFPSVVENTDGSVRYTYTVKSMQIGSIENLVQIGDDNTLYFCFEINSLKNGTHLSLNLSQPADAVQIYSANGNVPSSEQKTALNELNRTTPLLNYQYAVSNTLTVPQAADFSNLAFLDTWTAHSGTGYNLEYTYTGSGTYYLYLKVTPAMNYIGKAAIILSNLMPCQVLLDNNWEIVVH